MDEFDACYLGIPLPPSLKEDFNKITRQVGAILVEAAVAQSEPHITICYLGQQAKSTLLELETPVRRAAATLKDEDLRVGSMGTFGGGRPRVVYLKVEPQEALRQFFNNTVKIVGSNYVRCDQERLVPHVTVARLRSAAAKAQFRSERSQIQHLLDTVSWQFVVCRIGLFVREPGMPASQHKELYAFTPEGCPLPVDK